MRTTTFVCLLLIAPKAFAGDDTIDTRITFSLSDSDLLRGPASTSGASPTIPNALPTTENRLFFDDFEKRDNGFENLTHFVLYTKQPGFFEGVTTEAGLVLRAQVLNAGEARLGDAGSYLKLTKELSHGDLALTAFPLSADRFRLGYSFDISWGGDSIFKGSRAVPGARVDYKQENFYVFLGGKTGVAQFPQNDGAVEEDTVWGVLGGAGLDVIDGLTVETNGGYFYRGIIDKAGLIEFNNGQVERAPWQGFGGSGQVTYRQGLSVGQPIDFRLYRNDPEMVQDFFRPEPYNDKLSYLVQSEFSWLGQTLQDPERPSSTVIQPAMAGDLTARIKYKKLRVHVLGVFRDLAFIKYDTPSIPPFIDFPDGTTPHPELFFSSGVDYYLESLHLTPGLIVGVQRPAHQTQAVVAGANPPANLGEQTQIFPAGGGTPTILNPGDKVKLVYASKLTGRWDLSKAMTTIFELQLSYDRNRTRPAQDPSGISIWKRGDPTILGFNMLLRARF